MHVCNIPVPLHGKEMCHNYACTDGITSHWLGRLTVNTLIIIRLYVHVNVHRTASMYTCISGQQRNQYGIGRMGEYKKRMTKICIDDSSDEK